MSASSGKRVYNCRVAKGLTQTDLADLVGLTAGRISQVENGAVVRPKKMVLLAKALGTTVEYLFGVKLAAVANEVDQVADRQYRLAA